MVHEIALEPEQEDLLITLVEAARSLPREERREFYFFKNLDNVQGAIIHPGLHRETLAPQGDIEILNGEGLVLLTYGSGGLPMFNVTPHGFSYYTMLKKQHGESVERIEATIKQYLNGTSFQTVYPLAFTKWQSAEDTLWSSDSEPALTTIGHQCREAMQVFATSLVQSFEPPDPVDSDKAHTVSRLKAVIAKASSGRSGAERQLLDALVEYWGAVSDMVQRQEHGAAKEGSPLVWEDGRRVVFQTAVVMFEIARALGTIK